mgnify:CR=1 FL=1
MRQSQRVTYFMGCREWDLLRRSSVFQVRTECGQCDPQNFELVETGFRVDQADLRSGEPLSP